MKNKLGRMTVLCCLFCALYLQAGEPQEFQGKHVYSVCSLLKKAKILDGHLVMLRGSLVATMESVRIEDKGCAREIYVSFEFEVGHNGPEWQDWENSVSDQIAMRDLRPVSVTLEGMFHRQVGRPPDTIAQLELKRVLAVKR